MTLSGGESFLQSAIERAFSLDISGEICIVTRKEWTGLVALDVLSLAERLGDQRLLSKVLIMSEPYGRNTAPAIAWTAKYLLSLNRGEPVSILLMASDHIISPPEAFKADVLTAAFHAGGNNLVSFAIPPSAAETGYGYIRAGKAVSCALENATSSFFVDSFREKPDAETARKYLADGNYYWNSGIYAFRADFFLSQLELHAPEISVAFDLLGTSATIGQISGIRVMTAFEGLERAYAETPAVSIDYAISEKCTASVAVRATFKWDDVGTWDSLSKYFKELPPNTVSVGSKNCFVYSDIPVALCGIEDIVVVIRDGKALVSKKGQTNLVKDALNLLKEKGIS